MSAGSEGVEFHPTRPVTPSRVGVVGVQFDLVGCPERFGA